MTEPYYQDETITLLHGDALEQARLLPDASVDCIVTSPPYYGLRDYGNDGQYGAEETPAAYVETMRALFAELRRALTDDGTLWLNLGDSYSKGKQLLGIPWRVALALQDDGWILRSAVVWHKTNAMPESVSDRLSRRYEQVFLFTKSSKYSFDLNPIREPHAEVSIARAGRGRTGYEAPGQIANRRSETTPNRLGKNPGDVWAIPNKGFKGAHFATFPPSLVERCILSGCVAGGTVLDPFSGSGTTGIVSKQNGRKYVGIDVNKDYLDLSLDRRFGVTTLPLKDAA